MSDPKRYNPAWDEAILLGTGMAHAIAEAAQTRPAGKLYLPDPEQRHGWRESYVPAIEKPNSRPLGFKP